MQDTSVFRRKLGELVSYYYKNLDNGTGGYLHVVLDDGNIDHSNIRWCRIQCAYHGDTFGFFLCDVLMDFSEKELEALYENKWKELTTAQ